MKGMLVRMNSIQKNFIYNVLYQVLLVVLPLVTAPYISRTLGANAVGIYSYTNSVAYYFLLVAMLGISNHGNRSIAAVRDNQKELDRTFSSIFTLQAFLYAIAIISYVLYVCVFTKDNRIIYIIQVLYVVSGLFDISWLFFGLEKFKLTVTRNVVIKLLTVVCIFVFVHTPDDLWKYTLIMTLGILISQMYLWLYVGENVKYTLPNVREVVAHVKPVIVLFIPVLAYSIYKVMDKIMLGNMADFAQVGFYNNAEKIINIPMGIITALGTVMLPRMSNLIANGNGDVANKYIRVSMKLVTLIASAIAFGLIGVSDVLAPVFFGTEFIPCAPIMKLLATTVFFISWANVIRTQYLIPNHLDSIYLTSTIVGAVLNLVINWMLIPIYQANGAAIGTIVAEFTVMFIQMICVRKELPVYKCIFEYLPIMGIGIVMMLFTQYLGSILGERIATLMIQITCGGILFCVLSLLYYIIGKDELGLMGIKMIKRK